MACSTNGEKRNAYKILMERDHWEDRDKGGWTKSKWI
jgi:hypothetical protein